MSISLLSSNCLLILFLCSCTLKLSLLFHVKMEVFRQIFGEQTKCTDVIRTKMHVYRLGAQNTYRRFILNFSICSTNQYNYLCSFTKNKKKKERFLFTVWHTVLRCSMTSWRLGNEGSLHACKQICACYFLQLQDQIFGARCSQFPCGSLGGVVFHASFFAVR